MTRDARFKAARLLRGIALLAALTAGANTMDAKAQSNRDSRVARCPAEIPAPVAGKRQAVKEAAARRDWLALARLAGAGFQWGSYEEGDPVPSWKEAAARGEDPARPLLAILDMPCVVIQGTHGKTTYVWPSAAGIDWRALGTSEKSALQALYGASIDQYWLEGRTRGYYVGWSVGIDSLGAWMSFTVGD